jgi:hypothetical protein
MDIFIPKLYGQMFERDLLIREFSTISWHTHWFETTPREKLIKTRNTRARRRRSLKARRGHTERGARD